VIAASTRCGEAAGEHRRVVAEPDRGRAAGTRDADEAAPMATADRDRRFGDLANLVYDPAFLVVAWDRVRGNKGARTAGVDGVAPRSISFGAARLLAGLRDDLKAGRFVPRPVREKTIPKTGGKVRALGIPTTADRIVQAALKLVLEPIFEADFEPCSYGFRPKRRAQDAIAEIHYLGSPPRNYEWVFEGDITACFDEIDQPCWGGCDVGSGTSACWVG
jgi:RNA-directed DNA polymerase